MAIKIPEHLLVPDELMRQIKFRFNVINHVDPRGEEMFYWRDWISSLPLLTLAQLHLQDIAVVGTMVERECKKRGVDVKELDKQLEG